MGNRHGKGRGLALRRDLEHGQDHPGHVLPLYLRSLRFLRHVFGYAGR